MLNAIVEFVDKIKQDTNLYFLERPKWLQNAEIQMQKADDEVSLAKAQIHLDEMKNSYNNLYGKVSVSFNNVADVVRKYRDGDFIIAFYEAERKPYMAEPKTPTKPKYSIKGDSKKTATDQLLNFLSDLKIQAALASNENMKQAAEDITKWFDSFEHLLRRIFKDDKLSLIFNFRNYEFTIHSEGKKFNFNQLSAGYAAVLDIVVDLILKMQNNNSLSSVYNKEGIVFIDEVEAHLHLALQKDIMQILTEIFPNIQFVVTTHSPFILSSIPSAVAYDLEHREILSDLTEYSYESLAEGYFGVMSPSSYIEMQLKRLKDLLEKKDKTESDKVEIKQLSDDFKKIPESVAPLVVGGYLQLATQYSDLINSL